MQIVCENCNIIKSTSGFENRMNRSVLKGGSEFLFYVRWQVRTLNVGEIEVMVY